MSSACSKTVARYKLLKRSTAVFEPSTEIGKNLNDCPFYTLIMYLIVAEANITIRFTAFRKAKVETMPRNFMSSPETTLIENIFNASLLPM